MLFEKNRWFNNQRFETMCCCLSYLLQSFFMGKPLLVSDGSRIAAAYDNGTHMVDDNPVPTVREW